MRIKVFIVPVLIVATVIFSIWIVVPQARSAYGKIAELKEAENKLLEIREKNQKAGEMEQRLIENSENQNTLMKFLPGEKKEEIIIDNLNYLAGKEGLAIFNLDVSQSAKNGVAAAQDLGGAKSDGDAAGKAQGSPVSGAGMRDFKITVGVAGEYGKIKSFFEKISKLERFSRVESIKISKAQDSEDIGEQEITGSSLEASAVLNFNYIEKSEKTIVNADNSIFLGGKFDMAAIESIREKMNINLLELTIDRIDGANPFFPAK